MLLGGGGALDRGLYQALYAGGHPLLIAGARFFTLLGEPTVLIIAGAAFAVWLWFAKRARAALLVAAVPIFGRALTEVQKYAVARPRPDLEPHLVIVRTHSFPSGHAASSMIFYLTLALVLAAGTRWHRAAAVGAVVLSLLIGTSRVMLGVHWPSDVIGGWAFGMLWVLLALSIAGQMFQEPIVTSS